MATCTKLKEGELSKVADAIRVVLTQKAYNKGIAADQGYTEDEILNKLIDIEAITAPTKRDGTAYEVNPYLQDNTLKLTKTGNVISWVYN